MWRRLFPAVAAALLPAACADLRQIEPGICGNFVVDPGEDCDRLSAGPTTKCAGPGEAHPCRFVCSSGAVCAPGYGCGGDGVCRRASDPPAFALTRELGFPLVEATRVEDLDGDGSPDVLVVGEEDGLGRRPARILYTERDGAPFVTEAPALVVAPILARFHDEPSGALAFGDIGGVSLFEGTAERTFRLDAFPSFLAPAGEQLRAIPVDALPDVAGDELVLVADAPGGAELRAVEGDSQVALASLPAGEELLAGPIVKALFDEGAPCEQLVFTYLGADRVYLARPCRVAGGSVEWSTGGSLTEIALPGATVDAGAVVADLDADGHLDLLISASGKVYAAWGKGDGTFEPSSQGGAVENTAGVFVLPPALISLGGMPLAAADLDADGAVDFVLPGGVAVSSPQGYVPAHLNAGAPWSLAIVADLNTDGRPDVVAATSTQLDADFLNNTGGGVFNPSFLLTDGPVSHLVAGDVDGDLVNDLVVASVTRADGDKTARLTVLRGQAHGPPGERALLTELDSVEDIRVARLPSGATADGITDLVISAEAESIGTDSVYVLSGNGNRGMSAPFPLRGPDGLSVPVALAAGRFGHELNDIAVLGVSDAGLYRLWRVEEQAPITLGEVAPSEPFEGPFHAAEGSAPFAPGALLASADLDGDGLWEVVAVAPYGGGAALVTAHLDAGSFIFVPHPPVPLDVEVSSDSSLALRDVDGDGELDVVLLHREDDVPGELLVLRGDGTGAFDEAPVVIDIGAGVNAFTCLSPAEEAACALLVLSDEGVHRVKVVGGGALETEPVPGLLGGTAMSAADFDGDGVPDLVIGGEELLRFHRSLPVVE